jgi:hypothetical protein
MCPSKFLLSSDPRHEVTFKVSPFTSSLYSEKAVYGIWSVIRKKENGLSMKRRALRVILHRVSRVKAAQENCSSV